jgi:hypothetical protein
LFSSRGHLFLIYADVIVIFSTNKSLINLAIEAFNAALTDLNDILNCFFFTIAPEKCKSVIFTHHCYLHPPSAFLGNTIIPFIPDITYLGLTPKLRLASHIASLSKFFANCSNFHRSVTGTWEDHILLHYFKFILLSFDQNLTMDVFSSD